VLICRHRACSIIVGAEIRVILIRSLFAVTVVRTVTTMGDAETICIALYILSKWENLNYEK
jgi:hypothetical protein